MVLGPAAELADLFALYLRSRPDGLRASQHIAVNDRTRVIQVSVEYGPLHRGLNLRTGEPIRRGDQGLGLEGIRVAPAFGQVDAENGSAVLGRGQVDKDNLAEATLPDLFWRELSHIIRRREDEYVLLLA